MLRKNPHSSSATELVRLGPSKEVSADEITVILRVVRKDNVYGLKLFHQRYPHLLNIRLNEEGDTPLLSAIKNGSGKAIQYLLKAGASRSIKDRNDHDALDLANFQLNTKLIEQLNTKPIFQPLFDVLILCVQQKLDDYVGNEKITATLRALENRLRDFDYDVLAKDSYARQLDFYYTVQGLLQALDRAHDDASLENNFRIFFAVRESVLRGDDHDYFYAASDANQLCFDVAQVIFPDETPLNVVLKDALNNNRDAPWQNPITLDTALTEPAQSYFRSKNNEIQDYDNTVSKAVALLIRGESALTNIWYCQDNKAHPQQPLSAQMIRIIQQRCSGLKQLILHSQALENSKRMRPSQTKDFAIFDHLVKLRRDLAMGDSSPVKHTSLRVEIQTKGKLYVGTEFQAGASAHIGTAEFWEWWQTLGSVYEINDTGRTVAQESPLQKQIRLVSAQDSLTQTQVSIGEVLDGLWQYNGTKAARKHRDNTYFCVSTLREKLDTILSPDSTKKRLHELSKEVNLHMDNRRLEELKERVAEQLKDEKPVNFNFGSVFNGMTLFLKQLPVEILATLSYAYFDNIDYSLFSPHCSAEDIAYLKSINESNAPLFFNLLFQNPQLILINPKLSLFTAIIYNEYNFPGNVFFQEMEKYLAEKELVTMAMQILEHAFAEAASAGALPNWIFSLCNLSPCFYNQVLTNLAVTHQWERVWKLIGMQVPDSELMDDLFLLAMEEYTLDTLSHWRNESKRPEGTHYRSAVLRYWQKAMREPELANDRAIRIFNHSQYAELQATLLQARSDTAWVTIVKYVTDLSWVEFNDDFVIKLFKNALAYNVYTAVEIMLHLQKLFIIGAPAGEKPMIEKLINYCKQRLKEKTPSGYFWYSLWGWHQGMDEKVKLTAAMKMIISTRGEPITLFPKEAQALQNSRLGFLVMMNATPKAIRRLS
jgi:hypothetical protein